ncbi:hypothetical protein [Ruegeria atlantica]|uniref:hypothetical protein n=1 Tax=Ruegeria atlantica TaxID=81569 RepID=UPI00147E71C2|nr:hypothetical protein [Ruegeria atlantica]
MIERFTISRAPICVTALSLLLGTAAIAVSDAESGHAQSTVGEPVKVDFDERSTPIDRAPAEALSRIVRHSGKVMTLPDGGRYVFYLPLDRLWVLSENNEMLESGTVGVEDDRAIRIRWLGGSEDIIDLTDLSDITFTDEIPAFVELLNTKIIGLPLKTALGPLPAQAQLAEGGVIFGETDEGAVDLGHWNVHLGDAVLYLEDAAPRRLALTDIAAAIAGEDAAQEAKN